MIYILKAFYKDEIRYYGEATILIRIGLYIINVYYIIIPKGYGIEKYLLGIPFILNTKLFLGIDTVGETLI